MKFILPVLCIFLGLVIIYRSRFFKNSFLKTNWIAGIFILKIVFGLAFNYVYTIHYKQEQNSDSFKYFNDANTLYKDTEGNRLDYLKIITGTYRDDKKVIGYIKHTNYWDLDEQSSFINDSRSVIRFNMIVLPFSRGNIYVHIIIMCFLSFLGLFALFKTFQTYFPGTELLLTIALFGIPSVMFWSSGVLKEGLVILFLGYVVFYLFRIKKGDGTLINYLFLILALTGLFFSRFYVMISIIPALIYFFSTIIFPYKSNIYRLIIVFLILIIGSFSIQYIIHKKPLEILAKKQNDFINISNGGVYLRNIDAPYDTFYTQYPTNIIEMNKSLNIYHLKPGSIYHHWKNPGFADTLYAGYPSHRFNLMSLLIPTGSAISLHHLEPNFKSILSILPQALINVLFRPFINDIENSFSLLAFAETLLLIICILIMIIYFKKPDSQSIEIIIFSLLFVFFLYALIGISTPVLGAIVRYKIAAIPFLYISIFLCMDISKIKGLYFRIRK